MRMPGLPSLQPALRLAERAPKAELFRSRGDHYGVYEGGEDFDRVVNVEIQFLHRHTRVPPDPPTSEIVAGS
jgi:hypothetical protein